MIDIEAISLVSKKKEMEAIFGHKDFVMRVDSFQWSSIESLSSFKCLPNPSLSNNSSEQTCPYQSDVSAFVKSKPSLKLELLQCFNNLTPKVLYDFELKTASKHPFLKQATVARGQGWRISAE
jgi:hypothetical protein